jgi:hypothetical protein
MGNRKKIIKSEFPSEFHKSAVPLIAWNLGSALTFFEDGPVFAEINNI